MTKPIFTGVVFRVGIASFLTILVLASASTSAPSASGQEGLDLGERSQQLLASVDEYLTRLPDDISFSRVVSDAGVTVSIMVPNNHPQADELNEEWRLITGLTTRVSRPTDGLHVAVLRDEQECGERPTTDSGLRSIAMTAGYVEYVLNCLVGHPAAASAAVSYGSGTGGVVIKQPFSGQTNFTSKFDSCPYPEGCTLNQAIAPPDLWYVEKFYVNWSTFAHYLWATCT